MCWGHEIRLLRSWRSEGIKHKKNEIFLDVAGFLASVSVSAKGQFLEAPNPYKSSQFAVDPPFCPSDSPLSLNAKRKPLTLRPKPKTLTQALKSLGRWSASTC